MPNQLVNESSPYLRQHADNPVEWYPWGTEALELSRTQNKPILLSIGYAACHWCHVMAHESFEDLETAVLMNRHFINIKVDREERPDLDSIYMSAVQTMTGQGGWPMTVFLTPEANPFYGGTYYPPTPRYGMPSFQQVLEGVADAWQNRREEIEQSAGKMAGQLNQLVPLSGQAGSLNPALFDQAVSGFLDRFDVEHGGFGQAPKFPPSMAVEFLLTMLATRQDGMAQHMIELTLDKMAYGGLYDQIGGGFARYSTDELWLAPHFEKMLYDNALLCRAYLHAYQVIKKPLYRRVVTETLDFVIREMRHEAGGFYSSYDADSEGVEGKFYVWSAAEIRDLLGGDAALFMRLYDVTDAGNWEGHNILNIKIDPVAVAAEFGLDEATMEAKMVAARRKLYDVRAKRIWPGLDDKVLTSWNGLMLAAFAEAGRVLDRPDYTAVATQNAEFLYETMRQGNGSGQSGRLLRTWNTGTKAKYNAYLEDYAYLADGLLALYQTTFDPRWFNWAQELADLMLTHFPDRENGGFFDTSDDHEQLLHRPKDAQDNATPSANSMAAGVLLKLSLYSGNGDYWDTAVSMIAALRDVMAQYPGGFAHWLAAASFALGEPKEVAIVGDIASEDAQALIAATFAEYRPHMVVAAGDAESGVPLLGKRPLLNGRATAYVCRHFLCQAPVNDPADLTQQLDM